MAVLSGSLLATDTTRGADGEPTKPKATESDEVEVEPNKPESHSFDALIKPYLDQHCVRCHGPKLRRGELSLDKPSVDFTNTDVVNDWLSVLDMLSFEDMPPPKEPQPDSEQTAEVIQWIQQQIKDAGQAKAYRAKLRAPEYGNYVSHEKLFSGEPTEPAYSPSRLWRFSGDIYEARRYPNARSPFTYVTPESGIRDYAQMSGVDISTIKMILINVQQWLEFRSKRGEFKDFAHNKTTPTDEQLERRVRQEFKTIVERDASDAEAARYLAFLKQNIELGDNLAGLQTTLTAMFLSPEAIYRMEFGMGAEDKHGRRHLSPEETAYAIAYALTDKGPEQNTVIKKALSQGKLNNGEDVSRVVKQILDEGIDEGKQNLPDVPRVMRFFEEYFGFHRAGDVFKDNKRIREEDVSQWNTEYLIEDAKRLIEYRLREDEDVIARLLAGNEFFVAHPGDNDYAKNIYEERLLEVLAPDYIEKYVAEKKEQLDRRQDKDEAYKLDRLKRERKKAEDKVRLFEQALEDGLKPFPSFPFERGYHGIANLLYIDLYSLPSNEAHENQKWAWEYEQPVQLPADQRAGLLTHPAWLAAHSWNDGNDPIHRGIWVQRKLLAGVIPDVPPDVDAKVPTDPHKTLRERMDVLRDERCWTCHRKINPLGETFEMFDDWGRYRTQDYFDEDGVLIARRDAVFDRMLEQGKLTTRPLDATGYIKGSGDPSVDGEVKNAVEMMQRLGRSDRARQTFIRYLFRYMMGRNEMLSDGQTLLDAEQAYLENGGSFKALVASLLSSDSFLYRR